MKRSFLTAFLFCLSVTGAGAAVPCAVPITYPVANVTWSIGELAFDYSKTTRELRGFGRPMIAVPGYEGEDALTQGLTVSKIIFGGGGGTVNLQMSSDKSTFCFSYGRIDLNIEVDPKIYIAREIPAGTCMMQAVHDHEMRHYQATYDLTRRYREILQNAVAAFIRETGVRGPYPMAMQSALLAERERRLIDIVRRTQGNMVADNTRLQATIDTVEEYKRVANLCRGKR